MKILDLFFILFIINIFISFYSIYTFIDIKILHNKQGSKLKLKHYNKGAIQTWKKDLYLHLPQYYQS